LAGRGHGAEPPTPQTTPALGAPDFQPSSARPVGWRGDGSGAYPAASPVTRWSPQQHILWATEVGTGCSSPLVVGSRVFVTAEPDLLLCLDAATGKELWRKAHKVSDVAPALPADAPIRTSKYGDVTPTPVSDGKWVWVFIGTGIVACYDLEGKPRWAGYFDLRQATPYGRTASPVLVGDRLLVHFGPLVCLEAATGKLLWQNETAKATYGTPAPTRIGDVDVVITPKGHLVRVADGKILAADLGHCMYTSPVVQGRVVYFMDTGITAVQLPEQPGDQVEAKELWYEDLTGDFYASPLVHGGRIYAIDQAANYRVIDARTGKTILKQTLELPPAGRRNGPSIYPSPCLAGQHLWIGNDAGESVFLKLGDQVVQVGAGSLPAGSGGTPVFAGQRVFVRGGKQLRCIGAP
jgi:outer membrane protein assembly factor BamB